MRLLGILTFLLSIESWGSPQSLNYVLKTKCTIEVCESLNFNCHSYSANNSEKFTFFVKNGERGVEFEGANFKKGFAQVNESGDFFGEVGRYGEVHWTGVSGRIKSDNLLEANSVTILSPNQTSTCHFKSYPSKY